MAETSNPMTFKEFQRKGDVLKLELDKLEEVYSEIVNGKVEERKRQAFLEEAKQFSMQCDQFLQLLPNLKPDMNTANIDLKREDEEARLQNFKVASVNFLNLVNPERQESYSQFTDGFSRSRERLRAQADQIKPGSQESGRYTQQIEIPISPVRKQSIQKTGAKPPDPNEKRPLTATQYEVLQNWTAEKQGDLNLKKGEIVNVLSSRDDGWWECENEFRDRGLVPSNYLKPPFAEYAQLNEEEMRSSDQLELAVLTEPPRPYSAPSSPSRQPTKTTFKEPQILQRRSASESRTRTGDIGALPSGFTVSSLQTIIDSELTHHCSLSCHLNPKLSHSNLGFHDLFWNYEANKLLKRKVRLLKRLRFMRCEFMPLTEQIAGLDILYRFVRICLFDGKEVLSNVHTIIAQYNGKRPRNWTFIDKLARGRSVAEHGDVFVRSNYAKRDVVLLIECAMTVRKVSSGESTTVQCGWTTLPLLLESGIDSSDEQNKPLHIGHKTVQSNSGLPDILIWNTALVSMTYYYRTYAGMVLIKQVTTNHSAETIPDAFLGMFPKIAEYADIVDVLYWTWNKISPGLPKECKKFDDMMSLQFRNHFLETAFVLFNSVIMPEYCLFKPENQAQRLEMLSKFLDSYQSKVTATCFLDGSLMPNMQFYPLNIFHTSVNLVGLHAVN